ncbi:hypothetical protein IVB22_38915 [Bradyrhizobium sp. 190]|uniref:DUF6894 family protein n=1 Tax=Bradyrhizobium sp. 190 TaxID=2782658 RepID=UPI001FF91EBE|nr:hypothetical protein [Bradyrhizobium sp. 190]MCK1518350.1 hypothetical protein [Bradyrhizobium sp. 190]
MAIYYFDVRDGDELVVDEEGMELRDIGAAQDEAARSLAGIAWDGMRSDGVQTQQMAIEVRDLYGPVMEVKFAFVIKRKQ